MLPSSQIWGLWCQKQVSQAGISNCILQFTVGCNYLSLPEIPASGAKILLSCTGAQSSNELQWLDLKVTCPIGSSSHFSNKAQRRFVLLGVLLVFITQGLLWPLGIVIASACLCVCVCVCLRQSRACPCDYLLSGVPDFFDRNKSLSGYDLSHYQVPHCIRVFFYFVWFVFIHHNFQFYFKLCTYCNILDIYLS